LAAASFCRAWFVELLDAAAAQAHHVVVVAMTQAVLVDELAAAGVERLHEPAVHQEAQRAVDRGTADARPALLAHPAVERLGAEMLVRREGPLEDALALGRELEPAPGQEALEGALDLDLLQGKATPPGPRPRGAGG
jgi:hypothetical protein